MSGKRLGLIPLVLMAIAMVASSAQRAGQRVPQPVQPDTQQPPSTRFPAGGDLSNLDGTTDQVPQTKPDPRAQLKEAQKKLSADVTQLLQLATELKDESDKTKEADVLSLPLIHKAEEIEKLAKQIKDLARAN